jgi:hypothetical protein
VSLPGNFLAAQPTCNLPPVPRLLTTHCWTAGFREAPVRGRACTIPAFLGFQFLKLTPSDVYPVLRAMLYAT